MKETVEHNKGYPDSAIIADNIKKGIIKVKAIRKMIKTGFETYVSDLYKDGKITIREAARLLNKPISETIDLLIQRGVKGNLEASDVITSIERFLQKS